MGFNNETFLQRSLNISMLKKIPPSMDNGVITNIGIKLNLSKLSAKIPIINPNNENVIEINNKKNNIKIGCWISKSIKNVDVEIIINPIIIDLVADAPQNAITISKLESGADNSSSIVLLNFLKKILKLAFDSEFDNIVNITNPGKIKEL